MSSSSVLSAGKEEIINSDDDMEKTDVAPPASGPPPFVRPISTKRFIMAIIAQSAIGVLFGLDNTIAANIQGPILDSLGEIEKLPWVGVGFPMGSAAIIFFLGYIFRHYEFKKMFILSVLLFEIGSAICGAAPNMNALIFGRVIAGTGGAGIYLGALNYVTVIASQKEGAMLNGLMGLCFGTGCIIGPIVGGAFAISKATWRWSFYINLPIAGLFAPFFIFGYPTYSPSPNESIREKLGKLDIVGLILNISAFTLFQVAATFSGASWSWSSAGPIALWVIVGVLAIALIVQQTFSLFTTERQRILPLSLLRCREIILLCIGCAPTNLGMGIGLYYLPLFFELTHSDTALRSAVRLLPFIVVAVLSMIVSGITLPMHGRYNILFILSGLFLTVAGACMHWQIHPNSPPAHIYGFEVLLALGAGIAQQTAYSIVVLEVLSRAKGDPREDISKAVCLINISQLGTLAVTLSIAGCVFENMGFIKLQQALAGFNFSDADLHNALSGARSAVLSKSSEKARELALVAITSAMNDVFLMVFIAGIFSLLAGLLMKREKVNLAV